MFSDVLNHASIVDGCRLASRAGVSVRTYGHCDAQHCARLLAGSTAGRKLVVTDTLFSMDGDWAPLDALRAVCDAHGALLVVDDAHATLLDPPHLRSACGRPDITVGTLSKAIGALGGFAACSHNVKRLLVSRARGQVYSTSLPLPTVAAAAAALRVAAEEPDRVASLWARIRQLEALTGVKCSSPIVSLVLGDETRALAASAALLAKGFHVPAIRPPTVPKVCSRPLSRALWRRHHHAPYATLLWRRRAPQGCAWRSQPRTQSRTLRTWLVRCARLAR